MTAKGKINASTLTAGDRIIVNTQAAFYGSDGSKMTGVQESSTKTGENVTVARVISKYFREAKGRYERRGKYVITTNVGTFEAAPIQTMWLAPEDAPGIKRAHVEALEENKRRDREPTPEEVQATEELPEVDRIRTEMEKARNADTLVQAVQIASTALGLPPEAAQLWAGACWNPKPEVGDVVTRRENGQVMIVKEITETCAVLVGAPGTPEHALIRVTVLHRFIDRHEFLISKRFTKYASACANGWHGTAPARGRMICPECPL